jgi:hypothetical protein
MAYGHRSARNPAHAPPGEGASEQLEEQAVALASQGRWAQAALVNQELLKRQPKNTRTLNRLGKCMTELGKYEAASDFYKRTLERDQQNAIARKSLDRLAYLAERPAGLAPEHPTATPQSFMIDAGRSTIAALRETGNPKVLAASSPGAALELRAEGDGLRVYDRQGELLGALQPHLAQRLLRLMQGGNTYAVALASITQGTVRVVLRETYRHPSQAKAGSFATSEESPASPASTRDRQPRPADDDGEDEDEDEEEGEDEIEVSPTPTPTQDEYPEADMSEAAERKLSAEAVGGAPDKSRENSIASQGRGWRGSGAFASKQKAGK